MVIKQIIKEHPSIKKPVRYLSEETVEGLENAADLILAILTLAGVITLTVMAPNALSLLKYLPRNKNKKTHQSAQDEVAKAVYYLKSRGYIKLTPEGHDFKVKITQQGRKKVFKANLEKLFIPKTEKWDGKWWLTVADVPVAERYQADMLRKKFKQFGFYPLQRTVWAYPYDPRDQVDFVSAYYKLDRYLSVMRADYLDPIDAADMLKFFKAAKLI